MIILRNNSFLGGENLEEREFARSDYEGLGKKQTKILKNKRRDYARKLLKNYRSEQKKSDEFLSFADRKNNWDTAKIETKAKKAKSRLKIAKKFLNEASEKSGKMREDVINKYPGKMQEATDGVLKLLNSDTTDPHWSDKVDKRVANRQVYDELERRQNRLNRISLDPSSKLRQEEAKINMVAKAGPEKLQRLRVERYKKKVGPGVLAKEKAENAVRAQAKFETKKAAILKGRARVKNLKTAGKIAGGLALASGIGYGGYKYYQYKHNKNKKK